MSLEVHVEPARSFDRAAAILDYAFPAAGDVETRSERVVVGISGDGACALWEQRLVAVVYGVVCHLAFALGVSAMVARLYCGMTNGRGPFSGPKAVAFDVALLAQFAVIHSFLLSRRGRRLLARLVPGGIGEHMTTTTYALIASLQVALTFVAWSPIGRVWWEPHGTMRAIFATAYASSWLLLMAAMRDAGLALQTGSLGWTAVARGRKPEYREFPTHGLFQYVRQPVYVAFALTLWTGPVWTVDHLVLAILWTLYCIGGPAHKERRYVDAYGARFERYREFVPYWVPSVRRLDPVLLTTRAQVSSAPARELRDPSSPDE